MSAKLHEEYTKVFSEIEAAVTQIDEIVAKEMTDADKEQMTKIEQANAKRYSRLDELTKALDARKQAAKYALDEGKVNFGFEPEGAKETKEFRKQESGQITAAAEKEVVRLWCNGVVDARTFAITTATANSIFVPTSVTEPLAPTLDHVLVRAGVGRQIEPTAGLVNVPCPSPTAGGPITQGETAGADPSDNDLSESFTVTPIPYGSGVQYYNNTALNAPGYDVSKAMLPTLEFNNIMGQEAGDITVLKTGTQTYTLSDTDAVEYEEIIAAIETIPPHWSVGTMAGVVSPALYSSILSMTSEAGNKLVGVENGVLTVNGVKFYKNSNFQGFGANHKLGVIFNILSVKLVDVANTRLNRYTNDKKKDQQGFEVVRDHGIGFADSGLVVIKTPLS